MTQDPDRGLKEQTLRLLSRMQARVETAEGRMRAPIAVVGMGLRFPGADDADQFWSVLSQGRDVVREVPPERWRLDDPASPARFGGFLDGIDLFDADLFGISPREACAMDPQQRLVLEVAWHALEDAGMAPDRLEGSSSGVFLGICTSDYGRLGDTESRSEDGYAATGGAPGVAAGRLAYALGLQGPAFVVDTACSSSLVATHLAMQALRSGECDMALAGGVNLTLAPFGARTLGRMQMLAPDGRCKAFDARADGFVRAEGCGVLVLKRLSDALKQGDEIRALLRGSALGQDGRSAGLTAPSRPAQEKVIRASLANAGVEPASIDVIEAHGTGTALGDPIEMHALASVFAGRDRPLWVGSVKSNIGHAEAAAGVAGLIKAILMVQHGAVPPSLHFDSLNPHIELAGVDLRVPTAIQPVVPALVGVSSFGFSGTNAHLVVAAAPAGPAAAHGDPPGTPLRLLISAHSTASLRRLVGVYDELLRKDPSRFGKFAIAAARQRARLRWWVCVDRPEDLAEAVPQEGTPPEIDLRPGRVTALPLYPFDRQRFWLDDPAMDGARPVSNAAGDQLLEAMFWPSAPIIAQHVVQGRPLVPASALLLRLAGAARSAGRSGALSDVEFLSPVEVRHPTRVQTIIQADRIALHTQSPEWRLHARAALADSIEPGPAINLTEAANQCREPVDPNGFQAWLAGTGLAFGPIYDAIREIRRGGNVVLARLDSSLPEIVLDAALRLVGALHIGSDGSARLPARVGRFCMFGALGLVRWAHATATAEGTAILVDIDLVDEVGRRLARVERLELLEAPSPDRRQAEPWRDWLHMVRWQKGPDLAKAGRIVGPLSPDTAERGRRLDAMARRYALRAVASVPEDLVVPRHRTLYRHLVKLAEVGPAEEGSKPDGPEASILDRCGQALPDILRGDADALEVLFADGGPAAIYSDSPVYRAGNDLVALASTFAARPAGRLRVLEIGAGTGGTTAAVLNALGGDRIDYWFTDVSAGFLDAARHAFPGVETRLLDVERPLAAQDVPEQSFDLVLAANVLHATSDLRLALRHALSALRPDGALILLESTTQGGWIDLVFGLTDGWWRFQDHRLRPDYPLLSERRWVDLLADEGLEVLTLPGSGLTLPGQTIMVARWQEPVQIVHDPDQGSISDRCMVLVEAVRALPAQTRRLQVITSSRTKPVLADPAVAALWGLARTLRQERPELDVRCLDADPASHDLDVLLRQERFSAETEVAYRSSGRLVPRLEKATAAGIEIATLDPTAWYLVTGAFGGLGPTIIRHLLDTGATRLVLVGRTLPETTAGLVPDGVELRLAQCNVGDQDAFNALLDDLPPIRGVVHAAGVLADATFQTLDHTALKKVLRTKVDAAETLDRRYPYADPFILFSSAVGLFGSAGQGAHVAASLALDAIAARRRAAGRPATSIAWGAWGVVGAAAERTDLHGRLVEQGLGTLSPDQGRQVLDAARGVDAPAFVALPIDRQALLASFAGKCTPPMLAGWRPAPLTRTTASASPQLGTQVPTGAVGDIVTDEAARILGHADPHRLARNTSLFELGLDSLMAVQLRNRLFERFGEAAASATLLFDHPTLVALTEHLEGRAKLLAPAPRHRAATDDAHAIAIIGIGCRFPGSGDGPEAYWQALLNAADAVGPLPHLRRDLPGHGGGDLQAAFLEDIAGFDAPFFGISPREAPFIDPQHRLLLEVAWEALADAAVLPDSLSGSRTGVFVGMCNYDYAAIAAAGEQADGYAGTGSAPSIAAGRLAYTLGLNGPALVVDTACSSSLVTVHLAVQSLRNGETDLALAGGVNLVMGPGTTRALNQLQMMASDARCKAFDTRADGFVRGEGCGLVVLKRLADALADGDPIQAVILGSALNQDGRSAGLTAPSGAAQKAVIQGALADAGLSPASVDLIEAHGTGTALGDPIEIHALRDVFKDRDRPLYVGAVKTNIGHTEAAAGIAGLVKAALTLRHGTLPANLHFQSLNPHIDLAGVDLRFPGEPIKSAFNYAGVSSFGFSGTNAHLVLGTPPPNAASRPALPRPRFERRRYWVEPKPERRAQAAGSHPLLGRRLRSSVPQRQFEQQLSPAAPAWLGDHRVGGRVILPAAAMVEMMLAAIDGPDPIELRELAFHAPLDLADEPLLHTVVDPDARTVTILRLPDSDMDPFQTLASARFGAADVAPAIAPPECAEAVDVGGLYAAFERSGLAYGPAFRCLETLHRQEGSAIAQLRALSDARYRLDPRSLDAAWQSLAALLPEDTSGTWLLAGVGRLAWFGGRPSRALVQRNTAGKFDVALLDDAKQTVAYCRDVGMARIARSGTPAAIHDFAYQTLPREAEVDVRPARPVDLRGRSDPADVFAHVLDCARSEAASDAPRRLVLLTDGAFDGANSAQAAVVGLVGTIAQELPELDPVLLDLAPALPVPPLPRDLPSRLLRYVDGELEAQELARRSPAELPVPPRDFALRHDRAATSRSLAWRTRPSPEPLPGQVVVEVAAAGINFRDVMNLLGLYPGDAGEPGVECAGTVVGVGPGVTSLQTGDTVVGIVPGCFADRVCIDAQLVRQIPAGLDWSRVAGQPVAYLTAMLALDSVRSGERVLVHAGAGGVGHAVLALGRAAGACMVTTAGSPAKRSYLHKVSGVDVYDSRTLAFTQAGQVDRLINCLTGPAIPAGLDMLAPGGRFVELGRAGIWTAEQARDRRPDVSYEILALDQLILDDPRQVGQMLETVLAGLADGTLPFIPVRSYPFARLPQAMRELENGRHVGKLVLRRPLFRADATYLVTGGSGALGRALVRWLAAHGARNIVVLSRRPQEWAEPLAHVRTVVADVTDGKAVTAFVSGLGRPLKGVFHLAGLLDDGVIGSQTAERFERVLAPKYRGAVVLDGLAASKDLDHFVLFGSLAALTGSAGQANYAAANAALASIVNRRCASGLSGLLVDWSAWAGAGMATGRLGPAITPEAALAALGELLCDDTGRAAVVPDMEAASGNQPAVERVADLQAMPASERRSRLAQLAGRLARQVLELGDLPVDPSRPLTEIGLDSLMAVELRNALVQALGRSLSPTVVLNYPSIELLTAHLVSLYEEAAAPLQPPVAALSTAAPAGPQADGASVVDELELELARAGY